MSLKTSRKRGDANPNSGKPNERGARSKPDREARPPGILTLVATPIGNLRDISLRALDILASANLIACEDTRQTRRLLGAHGVKPGKLIACHDHNENEAAAKIVARLEAGDAVCLVSDAGMPTVSDPGHRVVQAVRAAGLTVTVAPGASAALAALAISGLPSDRFLFAGFPPRKAGQRRRFLEELAPTPATLILYEAPGRVAATLADMAAVLGPREAAVARELTKLYEEVRRGSLSELAEHYANAEQPKGELVLLAGPPLERAAPDQRTIDDALAQAMRDLRVKDAAGVVADQFGLSRRDLYQRALELAKDAGEDE